VYGTATGTLRSEPGKTRAFLIAVEDIDHHKDRFAFDHYQILKDWLAVKNHL